MDRSGARRNDPATQPGAPPGAPAKAPGLGGFAKLVAWLAGLVFLLCLLLYGLFILAYVILAPRI